MNMSHSVKILIVVAVVNIFMRLLPFMVFRGDKPLPKVITYLSKVLPYALIGMLVVYCLKDISILSAPHGLPEFIACAAVALLHIWKKNMLLSVFGGTIFYMILIQFVF